jgi:cyclase
MFVPRVMPVLLIDDGKLVKSVKFKNRKYIGDPLNAIKIFNELEVDEIVLLDISASAKKTKFDLNLLQNICRINNAPISVGGGINEIEDIYQILNLGVEKVVLCNVINRDFLEKAILSFGSSTISVCVNIKLNFFGQYRIYSHLDRKLRDIPLHEYFQMLNDVGVGEIIVQSVDLDGTFMGYDRKLYQIINTIVNCPVVALGGAKDFNDILDFWAEENLSGYAAGSMFVFYGPLKGVLINYPKIDKYEFRKKFL